MPQNMTETERKELAERLCNEIDASYEAQGSSPERWQAARAIYRVEKEVSQLEVVEGVDPYFVPLFRQRADRIVDAMMEAFLTPTPTVQVIAESDQGEWENADEWERSLDYVADQSGIRRTLQRAIVESLCSDVGVMRVYPQTVGGKVVGLASERILPEFVVGYPCYYTTLEECSTVGHRVDIPMREVKRRIRVGEFFDAPISKGSVADKEFVQSLSVTTSTDSYVAQTDEQSLEPITCYELITEILDGDEYSKYLCTVAYDTKELLKIEPYPYPLKWYISLRIDDTDDVLWPSTSLAQRMKGIQMAYSDGITVLFQGSVASAFPIITVTGNMGGLKTQKWQPGMILPLSSGAQAQVLETGFNPGALPGALEVLQQTADAIMGINQLGVGQALPASTRVAQIESLVESQSQAKQGYADAVAPAVRRYFQLVDMYLTGHFFEFKAVYGGLIPLENPESIPTAYRMEVTGQDMASTPDQQIKKMQFAYQLATGPDSELDPVKIEQRIIDELNLSFSADSIRKDELTVIRRLIMLAKEQGIQDVEKFVLSMLMEVLNNNAAIQSGDSAPINQPGVDPVPASSEPTGFGPG